MEWLRRVLGVGRDGRDTVGTGRESVEEEREADDGERTATADGARESTDGAGGTERRADGAATTRPRGQPHPPGSVPQGVGLFVDGPNVLRDEFDVDLDDVRAAAADAGPLVATRLYLDEHAPPGLIQAAEARGYRVITTSGDVDVRLAVDVARFAAEGRAATVAVASRDTDFKPAVEAANEYGLATLAIAPGSYGRSDALRNAVDRGITLEDVTTD